jgi:hypothetical protein
MKRVATLTILTGILVGGSILALRLTSMPEVQAQASCTSANFQGAYGYTFTGLTGFNALPFAAVGRLVADGQGGVSGVETASSNGEIFQRTYTGTYKVNPDRSPCHSECSTVKSPERIWSAAPPRPFFFANHNLITRKIIGLDPPTT